MPFSSKLRFNAAGTAFLACAIAFGYASTAHADNCIDQGHKSAKMALSNQYTGDVKQIAKTNLASDYQTPSTQINSILQGGQGGDTNSVLIPQVMGSVMGISGMMSGMLSSLTSQLTSMTSASSIFGSLTGGGSGGGGGGGCTSPTVPASFSPRP